VLFINYSSVGIRDLFYKYDFIFTLTFNAVNFNALFPFLYVLVFAFLLSSFVSLLSSYLGWSFNWPLGYRISTSTNEELDWINFSYEYSFYLILYWPVLPTAPYRPEASKSACITYVCIPSIAFPDKLSNDIFHYLFTDISQVLY
jgi:hypothetical protein